MFTVSGCRGERTGALSVTIGPNSRAPYCGLTSGRGIIMSTMAKLRMPVERVRKVLADCILAGEDVAAKVEPIGAVLSHKRIREESGIAGNRMCRRRSSAA